MEDQAFPIQYQANCPYFRTRLFLPANFKNSFPLQNALCIWYLDEGKKIGRKLQFYPEARGIHDRTLSLSLSFSLFRLSPRRSNANSAFRSPLAGFFYTPSITGNYRVTILPLEPRLINCRLTSLGTACAG